EDMSPHMGCYGETTIETPNIDQLAKEGTLFRNAFITCPVCSPSRSAMETGMYQTSIGAHNHRSCRHDVKIKLPSHIKLVSEYFQRAGFYTSNGGMLNIGNLSKTKSGKTDYNFVWDKSVYDGAQWSGRKGGQPFFAQFQIHGGKSRSAKVPDPVNPVNVKLPPYYPNDYILRADWATYLNSIIQTDIEVGQIMKQLEDAGLADETIVFFWTDHGISHIRGKQFLYEEGIHIPLIVRGPGIKAGCVRQDLAEHIDITCTSLDLAGIRVPNHMQGRELFSKGAVAREYVFAARDRCDETVDRIRCVRTQRFKYIRNYYSNRSHAQPNRYKDGKLIMQRMRQLYAEGKLDANQKRPFLPTRPVEELYDLKQDPFELNNLAADRQHAETLAHLRTKLDEWIAETRYLGQIPEPILAELSSKYDSFFAIMEDPANRALARRMNAVWRSGQRGKKAIPDLLDALKDDRPGVRYVAALWLGNIAKPAKGMAGALEQGLADSADYVRVASARAILLSEQGPGDKALAVLVRQMQQSNNEVTRHYAAAALEDIGEKARGVLDAVKKAQKDKYEYVKRVTNRIVAKLDA
ncbi:MAG: sulfatase-like hydrolase/transferase, partial [Planctomycetes bacterium]|nr:sulfatase-like hydrolase/transferase [Planctomycetota bacterium]